jgi:hypothetical protein
MYAQASKTLALLGGVATLALGSTFLFRTAAPKPRTLPERCAPRMLELEQAVCEPVLPVRSPAELAQLAPRPH